MDINSIGMLQYQQLVGTQQLENKAQNNELKEACQDFEAIFIKQMLDSMKKTVPENGLLQGGMAEDIFEDMLYQEYASIISKSGDLGVAEMVYKQLSHYNISKEKMY
jgi:peptidoglycan hydrolase FlgJ